VNERSGVYRLLGLLWRQEVNAALLAELCATDLRDAFESVGGSLPDPNGTSVSELAIDYCQLFVGPKGHLPPYQSVWQNGQLCGDATASMMQFMELSHYDASHLADGQFVDHFGVQLDVMAHLIEQATDCPAEQKESVSEVVSAFAAAHLRWAKPLLQQANAKANTSFYRSLADVTQTFLGEELTDLHASTESLRA